MIALTDKQWREVLCPQGSLRSSEWRCGVSQRENGVGPVEICRGRYEVRNGQVVLLGGCGEPCDFVMDSKLQADMDNAAELFRRLDRVSKWW